jgi:hypothetical protein
MSHLGRGTGPQDMYHCIKCRGMVSFMPPKHYLNVKCWELKAGRSIVEGKFCPQNQTNLLPFVSVLSCIA